VADPDRLHAAVEAALQGGAALIQYRDKRSDAPTRERIAGELNALCRAQSASLIINDDLDLAEAIGAAGVHLGAGDGSITEARRRLGDNAVIGATCGPWLERACNARDAGASYVAFGRFFASRTKPDAPAASLEVLAAARSEIELPICAIGGVTPDNGRSLLDAGADLLAAIDGVFGNPEPEAVWRAARAYASLFAR
jgi:thiamine-phosphate pyrophosphorylase